MIVLRAYAFLGIYKHEIPGLAQGLKCIWIEKVQVFDQVHSVYEMADVFRHAVFRSQFSLLFVAILKTWLVLEIRKVNFVRL
jgi:hypothetical protein